MTYIPFVGHPVSWEVFDLKVSHDGVQGAKIKLHTGNVLNLFNKSVHLSKLYALCEVQPSTPFYTFLAQLCQLKPPLDCIWTLREFKDTFFVDVLLATKEPTP